MALEFDIIRITADTSRTVGTTFDVTSSRITDFSSCLIIPIHFFGGTLGTAQNHAGAGWGAADKLGVGAVCFRRAQHDRSSLTLCSTLYASPGAGNRCLIVGDPTASSSGSQLWALTAVARSTSGVANGIRFSTAVQATQAFEAIVVLFGGLSGSDVVQVNDTTWPTSALSYTPNAVVGANSNGNGSATGQSNLDYMPNFGASVDVGSPKKQVCVAGLWDSGQATSDSDAVVESDRLFDEVTGTGSITLDVSVSSYGTQITSSTPIGANPNAWCLTLRFPTGVKFSCAVVPFTATTGVQSFSPFGFTPSLLLGQASLLTSSDSLTDGATAAVEGLCAFMLGTEYAVSTRQKEGQTINAGNHTAASTVFDAKAVLLMDDGGTKVVEASLNTLGGASEFSLNFTTASQAGRLVLFAIGTVQSHPFEQIGRARRAALEARRPRRRFLGGVKRAAFVVPENLWRALQRHRQHALEAVRWRRTIQPSQPEFVRQFSTRDGDSALATSERGSNALAASEQGD